MDSSIITVHAFSDLKQIVIKMRFESSKVIVTGGGSGIGRAICRLFAREGAKVVVADINTIGAEETVDIIRSAGGNSIAVTCDVSSPDSVEELIAKSVDYLNGGIDIVVNNAAAFMFGKVEDVSKEDWDRVLGVNVIGASNIVKLSLPHLKKSSTSSIVNIASICGFCARPAFIPYNTSKGALLQLSKCLAMDLAPFNIRVNAVCPGTILTPALEKDIAHRGVDREEYLSEASESILLKRVGTAEEVAKAVLFLASNDAAYITGAQLVVDGGATISDVKPSN